MAVNDSQTWLWLVYERNTTRSRLSVDISVKRLIKHPLKGNTEICIFVLLPEDINYSSIFYFYIIISHKASQNSSEGKVKEKFRDPP